MTIVILSGGLDSTTLLHYCYRQTHPDPLVALSFYYGQNHSIELAFAKEQTNLLKVRHILMDLTQLGSILAVNSSLLQGAEAVPSIQDVLGDPQPTTYVPFRNMIMLSIAMSIAESLRHREVAYGAQRHDMYGYWDTTLDFVNAMNEVSSLNRKSDVKIIAPLVDFTKTHVVALGTKLGVDFSKTWSCYKGQKYACGECPTCAERLKAFKENGLEDPIPYVRSIRSS